MTERLYYDDAYLTEFDATVVDCVPDGGGFRLRLDRSAFYPTSGGQPHDTGTLNDAHVLDVLVGEEATYGTWPTRRWLWALRCAGRSTGPAGSTTCSSTPGTT